MNKHQDLWDRLSDPYYGEIKNNEALIVHINRSKEKDKVTHQLGDYMVELCNRTYKRNFTYYKFESEDIIHAGVTQLLVSYKHFDSTKSNNPHAFFMSVIQNAFINFIGKEDKQKQIKEYAKAEMFLNEDN